MPEIKFPVQRPVKIAYFSPFPPDRSGIAAYSRELMPHLANFAEITLYAPRPEHLPEDFRQNFELRHLLDFDQDRSRYDVNLYQMGNSEYHEALYSVLLRYPGIVVLHDYFLHHFIVHRTLGKQDEHTYARELGYVLGSEGYYLAQAICRDDSSLPLYKEPLNQRALDSSLSVIVHSEFVAAKVRGDSFDRPVYVIPQIMESSAGQSRRDELDLGPDALLFAGFGLISSAKQIDFFLKTFKMLRKTHPQAHFLLVGETMPDADPTGLIQELALQDVVHHIGYVPDLNDFMDWVFTADVVINLRHPTAGETSAGALRAMAAGKPIVVFDHGWYAEIPDGAAVKVPLMDQKALLEAIVQLADSRQLRRSIGEKARQTVKEENNPNLVSAAYLSAIQSTLKFYWQRYG